MSDPAPDPLTRPGDEVTRPEARLAAALARVAALETRLHRERQRLAASLAVSLAADRDRWMARAARAETEVAALRNTRTFRWTAWLRRLWDRRRG